MHWQFVVIVVLLDWLQLATNPGLMPKHAQHRAPEELEALDTLGGSLNVTVQHRTEISREVNEIIILLLFCYVLYMV